MLPFDGPLFKMRLFRHPKIRRELHPDEAWQVDCIGPDDRDYHAIGATPQEAMLRLVDFMEIRGAFPNG